MAPVGTLLRQPIRHFHETMFLGVEIFGATALKWDRYYFMRFYDDQIKTEPEGRGDDFAQSTGVTK